MQAVASLSEAKKRWMPPVGSTKRTGARAKPSFKDAGPLSTAVIRSVDSIDEAARTATFVMSDPTQDHVGDSLSPVGARLTTFLRNPQFLWMHDQTKLPIGKWLKVWVEDGKLKGTALFATADIDAGGDATKSFAEACWQMVKAGMLNAVSVCFVIHDADWRDDADGFGGLNVTDWELLECSLVTVPMNPNALVDGKSMAATFHNFAKALEQRLDASAPCAQEPSMAVQTMTLTLEVDAAKAEATIAELTKKVKNLGASIKAAKDAADGDGDNADQAGNMQDGDGMAGHVKALADHVKSFGELHKAYADAVAKAEAHADTLGAHVKALVESTVDGGDKSAAGVVDAKGGAAHKLSKKQQGHLATIAKAAECMKSLHEGAKPDGDGDADDGNSEAGGKDEDTDKSLDAKLDPLTRWARKAAADSSGKWTAEQLIETVTKREIEEKARAERVAAGRID